MKIGKRNKVSWSESEMFYQKLMDIYPFQIKELTEDFSPRLTLTFNHEESVIKILRHKSVCEMF